MFEHGESSSATQASHYPYNPTIIPPTTAPEGNIDHNSEPECGPKCCTISRKKRSVNYFLKEVNARSKRAFRPHNTSPGPSYSHNTSPSPSHNSPASPQTQFKAKNCGSWFAIFWFGMKIFIFAMGWMMLAMHYFPH
uniref:Uncharacterized protein n=1 Tax=Meloidogyne hapla TaxID=6305 RepID=A0A1I8BPQ8_MELHA